MTPKAWLAISEGCWLSGYYDFNILAVFNVVITNGTDIILLGVSSVMVPYFVDAISIPTVGAFDASIFISAYVKNADLDGLTITNVASRVTIVSAGSINHVFLADIKLGNIKALWGSTVDRDGRKGKRDQREKERSGHDKRGENTRGKGGRGEREDRDEQYYEKVTYHLFTKMPFSV